jgi:protein involved in polysaccharide export with SLBB domain
MPTGKVEVFTRRRRAPRGFSPALLSFFTMQAAFLLAGCGDQVRQPSIAELTEFEAAAPAGPSVDMDRVTRARIPTGPYRVVPGDTLQLEMLRMLEPQSPTHPGEDARQEFKYRVDAGGAIMLPIVGRFMAAGKSLSEIEADVVAAYYPKYVRTPFPVHAAVLQYDMRRVSIVGAVARPGIYSLRHDEMSLVSLLMQAGGISEKGAAVIRITRANGPGRQASRDRGFENAAIYARGVSGDLPVRRAAAAVTNGFEGREDTTTLILPVKGLNIPFVDVALEEGDSVVVEWPREPFVTVVGLVNRPGNFPYPPTARYALIQAIGLAGGLDLVADPRYVSVYRLRSDGAIASVTVQLVDPKSEKHLTEVLALPLSPGDIVSVEHTPRTRANVFFERIFRINLGLYFNPDDFLNHD